MRHGGSETNETLTRSNISTKGITLLMFEEHLVDTLLGCLFQSSLLPPSTRHSLHCQNERSGQPIAKMRLIPCQEPTKIHSHYKSSTHPLATYIYIYMYILPCHQHRKKSYGPAFRPLQTNPGRAVGSWGAEPGAGKTRPSF